jgi:ABC-type nitrate/sulfonate/bicarbonate transport system substrate-binding protein
VVASNKNLNLKGERTMKKLTFVLVLVLMVISGCTNSNGSTSSTGTPAPGNSPAATAGTLTKVTFVVPRSMESLDDMALWSADYLGYFKQEGIQFNMEQAFGTSDIKMIATGQADFGYPSPNLILASIEQGLPVKAVSAADAINIFGMAVKSGSSIKTWQDLKGKSVALGDAAWSTIAAPTVSAAGLDPNKDIKYVVGADSRYQMVNEGKVDALFTWISEFQQLKGQGFDFTYLDGNAILPVLSNPIITSDKLIKSNPDLVKRFNRAFAKGLYFVHANPEAATDIVLNKFPSIKIKWDGAVGTAVGRNKQAFGTDQATTDKILKDGIGFMPPEKWTSVIDWAQKVGVIKAKIDPANVFTNDFVDTTWDKSKVEADAKAYKFTSQVYKDAHK